MQLHIIRKTNNIKHTMPQIRTLVNWTLMGIMLLQQMKTTDAAKFKGDSCMTKNQPGVCKEWGECPIIKTLIESGEYTNRQVVSCGFGVREELICCPVVRAGDTNTETSTVKNEDRFVVTTPTPDPSEDFWLHLLQNTTTTTTEEPFWKDLLSSTTAKPTTTTTTLESLIVGDQRLNTSSEFFDFSALLSNNKNRGGPKLERQTSLESNRPNQNPSQANFMGANGNGRGNLNTAPVNLNPWNFGAPSNNFNNAPGLSNFRGNGNVNFNRGQQNNGRGQLNNPQNFGRGQLNNGRGQQNNGRGRHGLGNQNGGFVFPDNNSHPNQFFGNVEVNHQNRRPGRPVNNMPEQNPNQVNPNTSPPNDNKSEDERVNQLIKDVFQSSRQAPSNVATPGNNHESDLDKSIANIFNITKPQTANNNRPNPVINNPQPSSWIQPNQNIPHNPEVEIINLPLSNAQPSGNFEVITTVGNQDLDTAPSSNFIQQPVVVQSWPNNPVQMVFENLVNSGMDIVKAHEVEHVHNQQQPQLVQSSQLGQQPPQFVQQTWSPSQFGQQTPQLVEQSESSAKEARSASPQQAPGNAWTSFNVQSPPTEVLDPFKPFEFRPPPDEDNVFSEDNNALSPNPTPSRPDPNTTGERPAVRACRRIENGLTASLSPHILGGTPAELGEFPHMAAIGYSRIGGDDRPPYDIRCGGTLIDKRFVLTAAHCVSDRENVPSIVRLGVVNFTDPSQMSGAVELRIKQTYIHDDYAPRLTYNDIAVLELERDVEYSEYVYPVCLYTDEKDPDTKIKLWVTGWGTVNTTTRSFSDILLKAPLHTSPLENCNKSFTEYGLNRRIPDGIIKTQFCAEDKDQIKDACQGDSGGPLNLIVDESYKKYRLVGVVSSGFGCASSTPGLYTRVAAFLDFIEKTVWPNGGD